MKSLFSSNLGFRGLCILLALLGNILYALPAMAAGRCYVNDNASGANNGTSWANAYTSLQSAISDSCVEIWVAAGVYKPHASDRAISFNLESGTAIYGGFVGSETLLSQRNYNVNVSILSGDIDNNDTNTDGNNIAEISEDIAGDNSYHVVMGSIGVSSTAVLDGFTITGGNANGDAFSFPNNVGGGIYNNSNSNPALSNLIIIGNFSTTSGGGVYNNTSSPVLDNVSFQSNKSFSGGGIANLSSNPSLTHVKFINNTAAEGGGMFNHGSSPIVNEAVFSGNTAQNNGGGLENYQGGNPTLTNITFINNTANNIGGGMMNNEFSSPTLINVTFFGNQAPVGGGLANYSDSNSNLLNVTISGNIGVLETGGMYNSASNPVLQNVIIWDNTAPTNPEISNTNSSSPNISYSVIKASGGSGASWQVSFGIDGGGNLDADPLLLALADNGGFSPTMAIAAGSSALNNGTNTGCPSTDQRGLTRPQGSNCEIGAVEYPQTFTDVPPNYWAWQFIESLYNSGITGGCSTNPLSYCPTSSVTRAQMAVFLLKGIHGSSFAPPAVNGSTGFNDVAADHWAAAWIKQLAAEGITGGCGNGNYCPENTVTRDQMAVFLLRAEHGSSYSPPDVNGSTGFTDVPADYWAAVWIKQLAAEAITGGCGSGVYCPANPVTRDQMAVFLQKTFNLPLP